jgi:hypothetical protein
MSDVLNETYKKYGYRMFNCSKTEMHEYINECYFSKKLPNPSEKFDYITFSNVSDAIKKIDSFFIPAQHGNLPKVQWSLYENNQLLLKEIWFHSAEDQKFYQCAVERANALDNHLDVRVEPIIYD